MSEPIAKQIQDSEYGVYFDWGPESGHYHAHVRKKPHPKFSGGGTSRSCSFVERGLGVGPFLVKPALRTKSIGFKVSEEEYAQLETAAQTSGQTLGEWLPGNTPSPVPAKGVGHPEAQGKIAKDVRQGTPVSSNRYSQHSPELTIENCPRPTSNADQRTIVNRVFERALLAILGLFVFRSTFVARSKTSIFERVQQGRKSSSQVIHSM